MNPTTRVGRGRVRAMLEAVDAAAGSEPGGLGTVFRVPAWLRIGAGASLVGLGLLELVATVVGQLRGGW